MPTNQDHCDASAYAEISRDFPRTGTFDRQRYLEWRCLGRCRRHLYGFLAAIIVFKILNELTLIQHQQSS